MKSVVDGLAQDVGNYTPEYCAALHSSSVAIRLYDCCSQHGRGRIIISRERTWPRGCFVIWTTCN